MSPDSKRVLIVTDGHDAALLSLYDYFTFRGLRVDCVGRIDDARALVRHVFYHAIVISVVPARRASFSDLLYDVRARHVGTRILAVVDEDGATQLSDADVDAVFSRVLPISQLARMLRDAIAPAAPSADARAALPSPRP